VFDVDYVYDIDYVCDIDLCLLCVWQGFYGVNTLASWLFSSTVITCTIVFVCVIFVYDSDYVRDSGFMVRTH